MHAEPAASPIAPSGRRWESAVGPLLDARDGRLWRTHSDAVNVALVARWLGGIVCDRLLKTDLFDEAMGAGLYPCLREHARQVAAIDVAPSVLSAAKARYPALDVVAADVRRLPFADGSFDAIVSNSTLDHFERRDEIAEALEGLHRVLKPGGLMLVTMDNLRHPGVALRNALPHGLLRRLGLVDYPAGATVGPRGLAATLRDAGFDLLHSAAILHCPRALAVRRARSVERNGSPAGRRRLLQRLARWEALERLPTRSLTAHYVGVLARKP